MSNLTLTQAGFDSSNKTNGCTKNSMVYYFPLKKTTISDENEIKVNDGN